MVKDKAPITPISVLQKLVKPLTQYTKDCLDMGVQPRFAKTLTIDDHRFFSEHSTWTHRHLQATLSVAVNSLNLHDQGLHQGWNANPLAGAGTMGALGALHGRPATFKVPGSKLLSANDASKEKRTYLCACMIIMLIMTLCSCSILVRWMITVKQKRNCDSWI